MNKEEENERKIILMTVGRTDERTNERTKERTEGRTDERTKLRKLTESTHPQVKFTNRLQYLALHYADSEPATYTMERRRRLQE